jgi:hypothetical protein
VWWERKWGVERRIVMESVGVEGGAEELLDFKLQAELGLSFHDFL